MFVHIAVKLEYFERTMFSNMAEEALGDVSI